MGFFSEFLDETTATFADESEFKSYSRRTKEEDTDIVTSAVYEEVKYKRIPKVNLDYTYINDSLTFGLLNRKVQKIMRAGGKIIADKKQDQKKYDDFFESISRQGQKITLKQFHERMFYDLLKYGWGYPEFIFNKELTKVVDLKVHDARFIDYARDNKENICFHPITQRPVGFTLKVGMDVDTSEYGDEIPNYADVNLSKGEIFILAIRIGALPLFTFGCGWEATGMIEPSYLSKSRKEKIVEAVTNELYIAGSNPLYAILGDSQRRASKQQKKKTLEALKNFKHSSATVFDHPTEIHALDIKHSDQYKEIIRLLKSDQSNACSTPLSILDSSADIPRSALKQMTSDMDIADQALVDKYVENFNKNILNFISEINGWGGAKLVWGDVSSEDLELKADLLIEVVKSKIVDKKEVVKILSKLLNEDLSVDNTPEPKVVKEEPVVEVKDKDKQIKEKEIIKNEKTN